MTTYKIKGGQTSTFTLQPGDALEVADGGESFESIISSGAVEELYTSGSSFSDTVLAGGRLVGQIATVSGATVFGTVSVTDGDFFDITVSSGGLLAMRGSANQIEVASGAHLRVSSGSTVTDATVSSGGSVEAPVTISQGETSSGGKLAATTTFDGVTVLAGAYLGFEDAMVLSGGTLVLGAGGVADNIEIYSGLVSGGGELTGNSLNSGGMVSGIEIAGDGSLTVDNGKVVDLQVGGTGGDATLYVDGSLASAITIGRGGVVMLSAMSIGAVLSGANVLNGGVEMVDGGGLARATIIFSGGLLVLSDGGVASAATLYAGGVLSGSGYLSGSIEGLITDRGDVDAATVISGGRLEVVSGGRASLVEADSAGVTVIASGGAGVDMTTVFGGALVDDGVVAYSVSNTLGADLSGDGEILQRTDGWLYQSGDAAAFAGEVVIAGGAVVLEDAGGFGKAAFEFAPTAGVSATLELLTPATPATGATFAEALDNFDAAGDVLDLRQKPFVSGTAATVSGTTLTLVDGGYSARFALTGAKAASYVVASDGHGGTQITAAAATPASLAAAMASFGATGAPSSILAASASDGGARGLRALAAGHTAGVHPLPAA